MAHLGLRLPLPLMLMFVDGWPCFTCMTHLSVRALTLLSLVHAALWMVTKALAGTLRLCLITMMTLTAHAVCATRSSAAVPTFKTVMAKTCEYGALFLFMYEGIVVDMGCI